MRNFLRFSNLIFVKSNKYILLPLCVTLFISSCSSPNWLSMPSIPSVPNWIKPSTALSSVTNVFSRYTNSDDNKEKNSKVSLLDVPKKPSSLSVKDSDSTSKSLLADKKNAKYKNEQVRKSNTKTLKQMKKSSLDKNKLKKSNESKSKKSILVRSDGIKKDSKLESRRIITTARKRVNGSSTPKSKINPKTERKSKSSSLIVKSSNSLTKKISKQDSGSFNKNKEKNVSNKVVLNRVTPILDTGEFTGKGPVVGQVYKKMLQQSAATVSTVPANSSFKESEAKLLSDNVTQVLPIIIQTYNDSIKSPNNQKNSNKNIVNQIKNEQTSNISEINETSSNKPNFVLLFNHDSDVLNGNEKNKLKKIVELQKKNGGEIVIVGHASSKTKNMDIAKHQLVNFKISLDRALAVASELIRLSVSNDQIIIKAVGASQLRYLESMPSGEAGNRRVEIFLTSMI